jgi:predicted enzyme related to lactoylglutathione lyase
MTVQGIGWTGLVVEDYRGSVLFFSEKLGLSLEHDFPVQSIAHFRLSSGQLLEVYGPGNRQRRPEKFNWFYGHALGFEVDDLEATREAMVSRGVRFLMGIETWKDEAWSIFLGPDNKLMQIQTAGRRPVANDSPVTAFSWAGVTMRDFVGAIDFFANAMGIPLAMRDDSLGTARFSLPRGEVLEIVSPLHDWAPWLGRVTLGFHVDDLGQARTAYSKVGVEFISVPDINESGSEFSFFVGPGSNIYALWNGQY